MKRFLGLVFLFVVVFSYAQISTKPSTPLQKDPYFGPAQAKTVSPEDKVRLIHADFLYKKQDKYQGNPFFSGNVQFEHKGSVLTADEMILYQEENFIKAIGNVKLQNADGSVVTAQEMEYDGNTQKGIARKNVVLTDPKQTIKTETLYYDRIQNTAYFNTGGTISDGLNTMYTKSATYFVSSQMIDFTGSVKIDNDKYTVEGNNIKQNQSTNTAEFFGPTTIINKRNPANRVYTELGSYNMNTNEVWLNKNSTIFYNGKTLQGDKMYYNQNTGFGRGEGNVTLNDPRENRFIKGGYGEIYVKKDSAMITQKPYAVKILKEDSMYFSAEKILAFQKMDTALAKKSYLRAYCKARFFKSNAQARADSLSFDETEGVLHFFREPILWSGEKQVTGKKIEVYSNPQTENIDSVRVIGDAFAISKADSLNMKDEFNQVKSRVMMVYYENNEVKTAQALGNAQAVTYADSQDEKTKEVDRIGVTISTCGTIEAFFEERRMQVVSCNIGANAETFPMSKIDKEKRFLSGFNWNTKDRLRKWQDIFLDTPNNPENQYISDDSLYDKAQDLVRKEREKEQAKKPKRIKK